MPYELSHELTYLLPSLSLVIDQLFLKQLQYLIELIEKYSNVSYSIRKESLAFERNYWFWLRLKHLCIRLILFRLSSTQFNGFSKIKIRLIVLRITINNDIKGLNCLLVSFKLGKGDSLSTQICIIFLSINSFPNPF